jgi:hypothetical protein
MVEMDETDRFGARRHRDSVSSLGCDQHLSIQKLEPVNYSLDGTAGF